VVPCLTANQEIKASNTIDNHHAAKVVLNAKLVNDIFRQTKSWSYLLQQCPVLL
jgi:hypothetical protein